jgi:xylulose-5-phosphate/fructose-6-phosphate phosphoketolase
MAATLDTVVAEIRRIQQDARANGFTVRPRWPMIILRSPKGWTGPKVVDGKRTEGTFRSHQVPMGEMSRPGHVKILATWLKSYRPQELFDKTGRLVPDLAALAPTGAAHERQPPRQRRPAAARSTPAGLPRPRCGAAAAWRG